MISNTSFTVLTWLSLGWTFCVQAQPRANFDKVDAWLFQELNADSEASAIEKLMQQVAEQTEFANQVVTLSDEQRQRLTLAGRGDVENFLRVTRQAKRQFERSVGEGQNGDVRKIHRLTIEPRELLRKGLFGKYSLFGKNLRRLTTDNQRASIRQLIKIDAQLKETLQATEVKMDLRTELFRVSDLLGWKIAQVEQFQTLLRPQVKFDVKSNLNAVLVRYLLSQLDEDVVGNVLDDRQKQLFEQFTRDAEQSRAMLIAAGLMER